MLPSRTEDLEKLKAQRETMAFSGIKLQAFRAAPGRGCRSRRFSASWSRTCCSGLPGKAETAPLEPPAKRLAVEPLPSDAALEDEEMVAEKVGGTSRGKKLRRRVARRRRWSPWHSPRTRSHAEEEPKESTSSTSVRFAFLQFIQYQHRKFAVGKPIGSQELPSKLLNPDVFGEWAGLHRILSGGRCPRSAPFTTPQGSVSSQIRRGKGNEPWKITTHGSEVFVLSRFG